MHEAVALCAECTVCVVFYLETGVCEKKLNIKTVDVKADLTGQTAARVDLWHRG